VTRTEIFSSLIALGAALDADSPPVGAALGILAESVCEELEMEALGLLAAFPWHLGEIQKNIAPRLGGETSGAAGRKLFEAYRVRLRERAAVEIARRNSGTATLPRHP
jgi:hypothetical protein